MALSVSLPPARRIQLILALAAVLTMFPPWLAQLDMEADFVKKSGWTAGFGPLLFVFAMASVLISLLEAYCARSAASLHVGLFAATLVVAAVPRLRWFDDTLRYSAGFHLWLLIAFCLFGISLMLSPRTAGKAA